MTENSNSKSIGKQINNLNILIKDVHTHLQYIPKCNIWTACKNYFKDKENIPN